MSKPISWSSQYSSVSNSRLPGRGNLEVCGYWVINIQVHLNSNNTTLEKKKKKIIQGNQSSISQYHYNHLSLGSTGQHAVKYKMYKTTHGYLMIHKCTHHGDPSVNIITAAPEDQVLLWLTTVRQSINMASIKVRQLSTADTKSDTIHSWHMVNLLILKIHGPFVRRTPAPDNASGIGLSKGNSRLLLSHWVLLNFTESYNYYANSYLISYSSSTSITEVTMQPALTQDSGFILLPSYSVLVSDVYGVNRIATSYRCKDTFMIT